MKYNFDEIITREGTSSVKHDLCGLLYGRDDVLPMWVADMDIRTPDFIIKALSQRLQHEILGYTLIPDSFYEAVVGWNSRRHAWDIHREWISFSPGVVPALSLLVMAFTEPGDSIIIQPPVYFPFFSVVTSHNRKVVTNPLREENGIYSMDFDDFEAKLDGSVKMLFLSNPHNPTGNVWEPGDLMKLAEICIRHKVLIISDEIHSDLIMPGYVHTSMAKLSDEIADNTITCMSPSKTFNLAGLSTAYLITPNSHLRKRYNEILDRVHVGAGNIFGFIAAEAAYTYGEGWVNQLMEYLSGNQAFLIGFIKENIPAIKVNPIQATYLVWLDCRALGMDANTLKSFMINEAGLALNDGPQFGIEGCGFQRINIGCPRATLHKALLQLHVAVDKYFSK